MNGNMMTINLAKGHFNVINGHQVLKVNFNDVVYPCSRYRFDVIEHEKGLPDISEAYELCIKAGLNQEQIIDQLIKMYFPLRYFRIGNYQNMVLVVGFIGMRGSGKTCSAVLVAACDYLLRGLPVWSNVPIVIRVVYKDAEKIFASDDLDELNMLDISEDYGGGCVLYDEINMEAAESTRYSSAANLKFSYAMQQIRKRNISLIWTCQGWSWIDNRLRWQTDFCVACRDASMEGKKNVFDGIGDTSIWRNHDLSGTSGKFSYDYELKHRFLTEFVIWTGKVWLRPWWHAYNTELLQGQADYVHEYKQKVAAQRREEANRLPSPAGNLLEKSMTINEAIDELISTTPGDRIYCSTAWKYLNANDKSMQTRIGRMFRDKGFIRTRDKFGTYWKREIGNE